MNEVTIGKLQVKDKGVWASSLPCDRLLQSRASELSVDDLGPLWD